MALLLARVVLIMLLARSKIQGYMDYEDLNDQDEDDYVLYDIVDDDESVTSPMLANTGDDSNDVGITGSGSRFRRDQYEESARRTISSQDMDEVKGALSKLLSRIGPDTASLSTDPVDSTSVATELPLSTSAYSTGEATSEVLTQIPSATSEDALNSTFVSPKGRTQQMDIAKLLAIISELAKDFEANLTRKLNDTIAGMEVPTCATPAPPTTPATLTTPAPPTTPATLTTPATTTPPTTAPTTTDQYDSNYTGAIIAKCFVCGLDVGGIPQHAHCADAFAGDFLPLVPVDTRAKGKISRFRKYCQYANIQGYHLKGPGSRVMAGRWTGGCAVRWIDLSGVYTQRTCRSRLQPTVGAHFASKRMAQLERALWDVEEGCIASPAATLTPLSRGVSLYARFHACVCAGSWCNAAARPPPPLLAALAPCLLGYRPVSVR